MGSMFALSAVDHLYELGRVKEKIMKLVFAANPLNMQH